MNENAKNQWVCWGWARCAMDTATAALLAFSIAEKSKGCPSYATSHFRLWHIDPIQSSDFMVFRNFTQICQLHGMKSRVCQWQWQTQSHKVKNATQKARSCSRIKSIGPSGEQMKIDHSSHDIGNNFINSASLRSNISKSIKISFEYRAKKLQKKESRFVYIQIPERSLKRSTIQFSISRFCVRQTTVHALTPNSINEKTKVSKYYARPKAVMTEVAVAATAALSLNSMLLCTRNMNISCIHAEAHHRSVANERARVLTHPPSTNPSLYSMRRKCLH